MWRNGIFNWFGGLDTRRKKLWQKAPEGPLRRFLAEPFPSPKTLLEQVPILAVDFETTGLNPDSDQLLSVGFVTLKNRRIRLAESYHQVINTQGDLVGDNVLIHQITDDVKACGQPLEQVVEALLDALSGKVMLAHHARIEQRFLCRACEILYGMAPVWPIIDTMILAKRQLDRQAMDYDPSALRLSRLRSGYNLPEHFAHNALNDAIATAELLLAQLAHRGDGSSVRLGELLFD